MDAPQWAGKRIAFFGGSFDPPHQGHLAVARAARDALALDRVLFAPVGTQPLKPRGSTTSFADRVAMTELAIAGEPGFAISLLDAPKASGSANYTVDTLLRLRAQLAPGYALFCLMGADSFLALRRWHRAAEIPFIASLVVCSRPGQALDGLRSALPAGLAMESVEAPAGPRPGSVAAADSLLKYLLRNQAGDTARLYVLPGVHVEVSASQVRSQIRSAAVAGRPRSSLLSAPVLDYIRTHDLYR